MGFKQFLIFYVLRVLLSFLVKTYLHPDEYWQSIEPAHLNVYGYGGQTWEWKGEKPIRSPSYHLIFAFFYYLLKTFELDTPFLIAYGPRLFLQPIFAALMDVFIVKYTKEFIGEKYVKFAILANFTMYLSVAQVVRTYANSIEATFFIIALYYWTKSASENKKSLEVVSRCFITFNFLLRGTSLIPWPVPFLIRLIQSKGDFKTFLINFFHAGLSLTLAISIDSIYYRKFVFTAYNFFEWNLFKGLSKHYGENPFIYFFIYGIPMSVMLWIPFLYFGYFLHAKKNIFGKDKRFFDIPIIIFSTIIILSLSKHKEVRFLLGIYPMFPIYTALGFVTFLESKSKIIKKFAFLLCPLILLSNYALVVDHGIFNYCGSLQMMDYIRDYSNNISNLLFLTKCHDTPFYAHVHKNYPMVMPNCDPDIDYSEEYRLYHETNLFLPEYVKLHNPSHMVVYSQFWDTNFEMRSFLEKEMNFVEEKRFLHILRPFHILKTLGKDCGQYLQFLIFLKKK